MRELSPFDLFVCDVLIAITDGETDDIAKFPMGTEDRLETIYEGLKKPIAAPAEMVRAWRDLDRRIEAEEITTAKAAELFCAEFHVAC